MASKKGKVAMRATSTFGPAGNTIKRGKIFETDAETAQDLYEKRVAVPVDKAALKPESDDVTEVNGLLIVSKGGGNYNVTNKLGTVLNDTALRGMKAAEDFANSHPEGSGE